jgi:coenzyme Q-binding protein COQ10
MPTHAERRTLPYTQAQLFDLVANVEAYPEFLPWCLDCKVTKRDETVFHADLIIGYRLIREKFTSRVTITRPDHIHVEYLSGPMKYLSNHWRFEPEQDGQACTIDFYVDFEFKNPVLHRLISIFFNEAVRRMVGAFEARARGLYG